MSDIRKRSDLSEEEVAEVAALKERIAKLRAALSSDAILEVSDILDAMGMWLFRLDAEIDDLDSRIRFIERPDDWFERKEP